MVKAKIKPKNELKIFRYTIRRVRQENGLFEPRIKRNRKRELNVDDVLFRYNFLRDLEVESKVANLIYLLN